MSSSAHSKSYKVIGQRLVAVPPMYHFKTGKLVYDGKPETISLGEWKDKKVAEMMADHVRENCDKKVWKIWVE
jgi:hypothetical protein